MLFQVYFNVILEVTEIRYLLINSVKRKKSQQNAAIKILHIIYVLHS